MSDTIDNINRHYQQGYAACLESYAVELKNATLWDILISRIGQPAVDALTSGEKIPSGYYEELHPIEDWHEDDGNVLWWSLPVCEPPYCGTPNDTDFRADNGEEYFTHFTRIVRNSVIGGWNKRLDKPQKQEG